MIYWVANKIRKANFCNYTVATDSSEIQDVCKKYDLNVTLTNHLCQSGTDRVAEVAKDSDYSFYCNVQGDEPLININGIKNFIYQARLFEEAFVQAVTEVRKLENDCSEVKVALDDNHRIRYLSRLPIPFCSNSVAQINLKCLGLYLYDRSFLLNYSKIPVGKLEHIEGIEQLRCVENDLKILGVDVGFDSLSVDTLNDLDNVRSIGVSNFL
jgi:3-deoxy-manno-octulosonate cytidylyltransferase (CMP-KDO synthetase)